MKNMKKLLSTLLIAAFFLTTAAQTDAFAWSPKKAFKKVASKASSVIRSVTKPVAKLLSPTITPIAIKLKEKIVDPLPIIKWLIDKTIKLIWGRSSIVKASPAPPMDDEAYIRYVSNDPKVQEALQLLHDKTPDVFRWIKSNLTEIKVGYNLRGGYDNIRAAGVANVSEGRVITLDRDYVDFANAISIAGLISHEAAHVDDYFNKHKDFSKSLSWMREFEADQIKTAVLDRLGAGAGTFNVEKPYDFTINGFGTVRVAEEIRNWQPGDLSTGGYWSLATTLRGRYSNTETDIIATSRTDDNYSNTPHADTMTYVETYLTTTSSGLAEVVSSNRPSFEVRVLDGTTIKTTTQVTIKEITSQKLITTSPDGTSTTTTAQTTKEILDSKILDQTEIRHSAGNAATTTNKYSNITYPPVGGPQGGIAPDVVNPNVVQVNAAVNAGGK